MDLNTLQHVNVKVAAVEPGDFDLARVIPVFHRWIQDGVLNHELAIDVADYRHVPEGPGVILIAHEAIYSLDQEEGSLGLLYDRRSLVEGTPHERLCQAARAALHACRLLEEDPELGGDLRFDAGRIQVSVNDRAIAPNSDHTAHALRPAIEQLIESLWGAGQHDIQRLGEVRERYRLAARAGRQIKVAEIVDRI